MEDKKEKKSGAFKKFLLAFFIVVFVVSSGILLNELVLKPYRNDKNLKDAQSIYYETDQDPLEALKAINPDVVSWIKIPNTVIDYPVVQATESDGSGYYLTHNYKREYTKYGSIFIDAACSKGVNSKNILIHGHNMNNGSMFNSILNFSDIDFYKQTPTITFDKTQWKVFAVIKVNTLESQGKPFEYLQYSFVNSGSFLNYIHQIMSRSLINTPVKVNENDQIITLSTCSYEYKDFRTAVFARKVRPGEDTSVDTSVAALNSNPLMPDCYYKDGKNQKPVIEDYNTARANNRIYWYG